MWYGCKECNRGPCVIERETFISCTDEEGNIVENVYIPKHFCTMPVECIPRWYQNFRRKTLEYLKSKHDRNRGVI